MLLTDDILDKLPIEAGKSTRLRMNYNLYTLFSDSVQRMFNALEPRTEVPIARIQSQVRL
ncbi:DUF6016 domain-containing protein [Parabacteroides distasonis]|uniref:DUF6016 domain-containing protein n=1 Tax=Parabacteroides distasonis TaxID=823 RepID=UPI0018A05D82|nr:DUF6016 domain-containing protein [Parabacteroides distasonis]MDB9152991.1 DUF6016 domain-containing protein [Parabacteroides distasonis]MDB9157684.1 DUF6016 domain-containing protein [Parabacteroides distasonis]MDB9166549.1 DUF6016 domain-containing protein [Parabacteroides distasonis]MDB9170968.1 DUF6016 domain-containing protein [Parabacteroides distasonis]MDB9195701.1 DUF6016 domain-containing protein [Parabacteroides distasonis]